MRGATGWLETSVVAQGVEDAPLSVSMATGAGWLLLAGRREGGCRHGLCASLCDFLERMRSIDIQIPKTVGFAGSLSDF